MPYLNAKLSGSESPDLTERVADALATNILHKKRERARPSRSSMSTQADGLLPAPPSPLKE